MVAKVGFLLILLSYLFRQLPFAKTLPADWIFLNWIKWLGSLITINNFEGKSMLERGSWVLCRLSYVTEEQVSFCYNLSSVFSHLYFLFSCFFSLFFFLFSTFFIFCMDKNILQALLVTPVNSKMASYNGLSLIFWLHPLHVMNNELFHKSLVYSTNNNGKKDTSQTMPFTEY